MSAPQPKRLSLDAALVQDNVPIEIVPHLFLGSIHASYNREGLQALGITHVLNISTLNCAYTNDFTHLSIRLHDNESASILSVLPIAHLFIESAVQSGTCLVHCQGGRSRSPALIISYLMRRYGYTYDNSHQLLVSKRSIVQINEGFEKQLRCYEKCHCDVYLAHQMILSDRLSFMSRQYQAGRLTLDAYARCVPFHSFTFSPPEVTIITRNVPRSLPFLPGASRPFYCARCRTLLFTSWKSEFYAIESEEMAESKESPSPVYDDAEVYGGDLSSPLRLPRGAGLGALPLLESKLSTLAQGPTLRYPLVSSDTEEAEAVRAGRENRRGDPSSPESTHPGSVSGLQKLASSPVALSAADARSLAARPATDESDSPEEMEREGECSAKLLSESTMLPTGALVDNSSSIRELTVDDYRCLSQDDDEIQRVIDEDHRYVQLKCEYVFVEPLKWMGDLLCPNSSCGYKVGSFDWNGHECSCSKHVLPAFWINRITLDSMELLI